MCQECEELSCLLEVSYELPNAEWRKAVEAALSDPTRKAGILEYIKSLTPHEQDHPEVAFSIGWKRLNLMVLADPKLAAEWYENEIASVPIDVADPFNLGARAASQAGSFYTLLGMNIPPHAKDLAWGAVQKFMQDRPKSAGRES